SLLGFSSDTSKRPPSQDSFEVTVARWRSRVAAHSSPPIRQILPTPPGLPCQPAVLVLPGQREEGRTIIYSPTATSAVPSRKRRRSPTTSVVVASLVLGALSPVRADLLSPRKRIRDSDSMIDFEVSSEESFMPYVPREIGLGVDVEDSYEPYTEPDIDLDVQANIDACIAFANDIVARGTNARVEVGTMADEEAEPSARGTIRIGVNQVTHPVVANDTVEPVREDHPDLVSADRSLEVIQRGLDVVMQELYDHMVKIPIHRVRVIESVQRDQGHRIVATSHQGAAMSEMTSTLETMSTATRSGMTQDTIDKLIAKRMEKSLEAYNAARNPRTETEMEDEQQDDNVKANGNNGNGNGNGNGNPNVNKEVLIVRVDAAYAMTWKALIKLMTEVYCPRNKIQKMETELWNLIVKGNYLTAYNQRFQELTLLCTKMVPEEEDQVEKYIRGLPDNILGNVIATEPTRLHYAIRIVNNLMDQRLKGYIVKNAKNKRRFDNNSRDNRGQQQPFKRQNVNSQNVARAYTVGNNVERKAYAGNLPYCNKYKMHHEGPCTVKCSNYKRVGHLTRDCKAAVAATIQRAPVGNQTSVTWYECGRQGHYRSECPKLRIQNRENKTGNKIRNNEAKVRAYAIGGGGASPDFNVVTGTFLLNNRYASMLFDSGADKSFVLTTFSALLDVIPST
ncbi:putative reverse transcriptase domain-containing protein, partial [Tanacetum coccineum]